MAIGKRNAVFMNCGQWKTRDSARCQACGFRPCHGDDKTPLEHLYLSLRRPGSKLSNKELRAQLEEFATAISLGEPIDIPESEIEKMCQAIRSRSKCRSRHAKFKA